MSHFTTIALPQTAFAHTTFTHATVEALSKAAWAIILGRYAGSDTVVLENHIDINSEEEPTRHFLDVTSSRELGSLLKQIQQISSSSHPLGKWGNRGTLFSKIHAAGGSITDNASNVILKMKDHSRGVSIFNSTTETFASDQMASNAVICTVRTEGTKVWTNVDFTSHNQETSHLVNVHVETIGSASSDQKHLRLMAIHFQNVLRYLIAKTNDKSESALKTPLSKCFEISHHEIEEIVIWNQAVKTPHYGPIHYIIKDLAMQHPDAPAIHAWDGQLTYAQLWDESSKLAQQLASRGVVLEMLVPFCFEKSAWAIVTMLAISKAGGAFVPLDPSWPRSRLEHIISKTQAKLMVTSPQMSSVCQGLVDDILILDGFNQDSELEPAPEIEIASNNLAYVLFTSGTTGQPKCVLIGHGNLSTSAIEIGKFSHMGSDTRMFQFASYGFDAMFIETMSVLALGGCICVPPESERLDDPVNAIQRMDVNTIFFTPSFLLTLQPETLIETTKVHTVITGGENLPLRMMEAWRREGRIGRAISGKTWIVDHENDDVLAPIGAVGELLLQGPAVGRGYLDDTKKTAAVWSDTSCFSWGHLSNISGTPQTGPERIYRTGDLVRYNAEGEIFYVGRKDTQVKLHGQRIELGEIEFHLRQHIKSPLQVIAEMITRSSPDGGSQIIAALIWTTEHAIQGIKVHDESTDKFDHTKLQSLEPFIAELDEELRKSLPRYMVPSAYIPVPHIPLTTSGKLDRRTLSNFAESSQARPFKISRASSPPNPDIQLSDMEHELSKLWAKFLNIPDPSTITAEDNFFHLDGNSIIAIKMVAAARQAHFSLKVQDIFKSPTLSKMASLTTRLDQVSDPSSSLTQTIEPFSLLDQNAKEKEELILEAAKQCNIPQDLIEDILPCTPAQQFYMDCTTYFTDARDSARRGPISLSDHFVYHIHPDVDLYNLRAAWDKVSMEYPILRTRIIMDSATEKMYQVIVHESEAEPITWRRVYDNDLEEFLVEDKRHTFGFGQRLVRFALVHELTSTRTGNALSSGYCYGSDRTAHLVMSIQHSICDAWMMRLLFDEVERVYRSIHDIKLGYHVPLPPRQGDGGRLVHPVKFNTLLKYMKDSNRQNIDAAAEFWREHLKDAVVKPFPSAHGTQVIPASQHELNTILTRTIHLPESAVSTGGGVKKGTTLSTSIYGALALLMGVYTSSPDVIFHLTRSGRDIALPGVESIIAPTLTRHPLRIHIGTTLDDDGKDDTKTVGDFLETIQTDLSNMVDYQFLGWSEIRRLARISADNGDHVDGVLGCRSSYLVNVVPMEEADVNGLEILYRDGDLIDNVGTGTVNAAGSKRNGATIPNDTNGTNVTNGTNGSHPPADRNDGQNGNTKSEKNGPIHRFISEGTFTPMPAGFYTSFVISADGRTVTATARYDGWVFNAGGVEKLLGGFEAVLGRILGVASVPCVDGWSNNGSYESVSNCGCDGGGIGGNGVNGINGRSEGMSGETGEGYAHGTGGLEERLADVKRWIAGNPGSVGLGCGLRLPSEDELYH